VKQLPIMQMEILAVDADNGVINTKAMLPSSAGVPEDFTVAPLGDGSRVTVVLTLPLVAYLIPPGVYRPQLCGALALAGIEVPGGPPTPAVSRGADQLPQLAPPTQQASDDPPPQGEPPPYEPQGAPSPPAAVQAPAQPEEAPLTNDEIVQLAQAGLGSDVIVAKINEAGSESFDLSTKAMIELRRKKVSQKVIAAMLQRHANGGPAGGSGPPGRQR
jgi:hypothetical protein